MLGQLAIVRLVQKGMGYKMDPGVRESWERPESGLFYFAKQLEKLLPKDFQTCPLNCEYPSPPSKFGHRTIFPASKDAGFYAIY